MINFLSYIEVEKVIEKHMFNKHASSMLHNINTSVDYNVVSSVTNGCHNPIESMLNVVRQANENLETLRLYLEQKAHGL